MIITTISVHFNLYTYVYVHTWMFFPFRTGELTNRLSSDTQVIQNAVTVKALFSLDMYSLFVILLGEHLHASQISTADYSLTDSDVLAERPTDRCSVVCSANHCNWSCPIRWVGLLCIVHG